MKNKIILICTLCALGITGCNIHSFDYEHDKEERQNNGIDNETSLDGGDASCESSNSIEEDNTNSTNSSNSSQSNADYTPWESPMAGYVPESPFLKYINFVKDEIATKWDDEYYSDYISGNYQYVCLDISGDGVPELIVSFTADDTERLLAFSYDSEEDTIFVVLDQETNSEYDRISKYGYVLVNIYKDESGNMISGRTDEVSCTQWIDAIMTGGYNHGYADYVYEWKRESGSSDFEGPSEEIYDQIMEMAEDQVTLFEAVNPEDMIPYLEECEENFENSYEDFKLFKQQGKGLFYCNSSDVPDNEYKDAESAYEAFINDETCVRCEYVAEPFNYSFSYVYGDKYTLSQWYVQDNDVTIETRYIDCGSDGAKELVIDIIDNSISEPMDDIYVISFYEGHLYLRFDGESSARSRFDIGDDGYIYSNGSSSAYTSGKEEAFLDSNVIFHFVYILQIVSEEDLKDYFPDAFEMAPAGEGSTIYIYEIDGEDYYVPYSLWEQTDEEDYTDFMNACVECGISFSTQEEVDAIIEAKKAEYGF